MLHLNLDDPYVRFMMQLSFFPAGALRLHEQLTFAQYILYNGTPCRFSTIQRQGVFVRYLFFRSGFRYQSHSQFRAAYEVVLAVGMQLDEVR